MKGFMKFLRTKKTRPLAARTCSDYGRIVNALTEPGGMVLYGLKWSPAMALLTKATLRFSADAMNNQDRPHTLLCSSIHASPHNQKGGNVPVAAVRQLETYLHTLRAAAAAPHPPTNAPLPLPSCNRKTTCAGIACD